MRSDKSQIIKSRFGCLYGKKSFKRNQDVVQFFTKGAYGLRYVASVVDGWNNENIISGVFSGRLCASYTAKEFPKSIFSIREKYFPTRAEIAAKQFDTKIIEKFPAHISCVGCFLFVFEEYEYIVSVGDVRVFEWTGTHWRHLVGISQHVLNLQKYPSDTSRFFGRGELKSDPMYSSQPDVVKIDPVTPILIATDGLTKMMTLTEFNRITIKSMRKSGKDMLETILQYIDNKKTQSDDITLLLRDPR
jgi:hypothetical protein